MIHLATTLALAFIIVAGVVSIISIICYSILRGTGELRKSSKENPSVKAARDNLMISRLHAEQDLIEYKRDQIVNARHENAALPVGLEEEIKEKPLKAVTGEVLKGDLKPRWK